MQNSTFRKKIFLSMPVSDNLASDGTFRPARKVFYESIIETLENLGLEVACAALNEDWGKIKLPPVEFTDYDLRAIMQSELLVLVTSERLTRDMYLEIGMAIAVNLPIFLFIPASTHVTFMLEGLTELKKVKIKRYDAEADVPNLIQNSLCKIKNL